MELIEAEAYTRWDWDWDLGLGFKLRSVGMWDQCPGSLPTCTG